MEAGTGEGRADRWRQPIGSGLGEEGGHEAHMQSSAWRARQRGAVAHTGRMLTAFVCLGYKLSGPSLHHRTAWTRT